MNTKTVSKNRAYSKIADQLIEMIESTGLLPWEMPYAVSKGSQDRSIHGRPYTGVNRFTLNAFRRIRGYKSPVWLTFNQVKKSGWRLKDAKGMGIHVIGWFQARSSRKEDDDHDDEDQLKLFGSGRLYPRTWAVFNGDLIEGDGFDPQNIDPVVADPSWDQVESAEAIIHRYRELGGPSIHHSPETTIPCYSPGRDSVHMPPRTAFNLADGYYGVMFHELGHSTGHQSRLNRKTLTDISRFGDHSYSREELVAEFSSAFLMGHAGFTARRERMENHAAYLKSWVRKLKEYPRELSIGAQQAEKSVAWILGGDPK